MNKTDKKMQQSRENLKRLKTKLEKIDEVKVPKEKPRPCILSFIFKLFRKTN